MMTKKRSGTLANLKFMAVLPVAAVLMLIFSACSNHPKTTSSAPPLTKTPIYENVDVLPLFPGGDTALMNFIGNNIIYPETAKQNNIQGRVLLRFCVTDKGGIDLVTVLNSVDPALDNEAIRVVKLLPTWTPGKKDGKDVNVWYAIPITFKLK